MGLVKHGARVPTNPYHEKPLSAVMSAAIEQHKNPRAFTKLEKRQLFEAMSRKTGVKNTAELQALIRRHAHEPDVLKSEAYRLYRRNGGDLQMTQPPTEAEIRAHRRKMQEYMREADRKYGKFSDVKNLAPKIRTTRLNLPTIEAPKLNVPKPGMGPVGKGALFALGATAAVPAMGLAYKAFSGDDNG